MDDDVHIKNNAVPLIPVVQPSPRGPTITGSPSVRNSPSIVRGPIVPTPPSSSISRNNQATISLRMPNIATTRPLTSPVNIYRSSSASINDITIPSNVSSRINGITSSPKDVTQRSPVNISNLNTEQTSRSTSQLHNTSTISTTNSTSHTIPINIPSTVRLPATPQYLRSEIINENMSNNNSSIQSPQSVQSPSQSIQSPSSSQPIPSQSIQSPSSSQPIPSQSIQSPSSQPIPSQSVQSNIINRIVPPILSTESTSISDINAAINAEIVINTSQANSPPIDPLIRRENIIPIGNRPMSPRDETELSIHGLPLDRNGITPIIPLDTDSDDEEDIQTTNDTPRNLINISGQPPINIPITTTETTTTADTTDGIIRSIMNGPISPIPPVSPVSPIPPTTSNQISLTLIPTESEVVIRPASPTTQVNIPISNTLSPLPPISSNPVNDSIINPAPPITIVNRNTNPSQPIQPPIASRLPISRNRQQLPPTSQPIPIQSNRSTIQGVENINQPLIQSRPIVQSQPIQSVQSVQSVRSNIQSAVTANPDRQSIPNSNGQNPIISNVDRQSILSSNNQTQPLRQPIAVINQNNNIRQAIPMNIAQGPRQPIPTANIRQTVNQATNPNQSNINQVANPNQSNINQANHPPQVSNPPQSNINQTTNHNQASNSNQPNINQASNSNQPNINQTTNSHQSNINQTTNSHQASNPNQSNNQVVNSAAPGINQTNNQVVNSAASGINQLSNPNPTINSTAPGIRQPIPINSNAPGIRQPIPINTNAPGIRQPIPINTATQGNRQATTQTSGITGSTDGSSTVWDSTTNSTVRNQTTNTNQSTNTMTGTPKINDTQPLPSTMPTIQAPVLPPPNVPNYSGMSAEEQAQHRANFRTRFGILRNAWPNYHIPDVPDDMPLEQIHAQYDIYVRHIHISRDVDQYKVYLVIMWLLIELFCTKIGLNIGGYTVSQMRSMNKYERLLIELGETNYKSSGGEAASHSNWPVEVRIFFMALVNAVTFIIIKMLANYIGENMATTIVDGLSSYLSGSAPQPGQVLFGGPSQSPQTTPQVPQGPQGPPPGGAPLPQMGGAFGGIDIASLLGNLGSMFIRGQMAPANNNNHAPAPAPVPSANTAVPQTPTTPRFRPAYDD
jgi:hypothetical protein